MLWRMCMTMYGLSPIALWPCLMEQQSDDNIPIVKGCFKYTPSNHMQLKYFLYLLFYMGGCVLSDWFHCMRPTYSRTLHI